MHVIAKDFSFCFGHRVWSQVLNAEFANDLQCACRHLHGHEGRLVVHLTAPSIVNGMVTDFRHLEWLKKFLDSNLDHRFILDRNDPLFSSMTKDCELAPVLLPGVSPHHLVGFNLSVPNSIQGAEREYLESFFIVDFVPTSEHFSAWMHGIVEAKMSSLGVSVHTIEWWESTKSRSIYTSEGIK